MKSLPAYAASGRYVRATTPLMFNHETRNGGAKPLSAGSQSNEWPSIGGFVIEGVLGQGASSIVYLARQARPHRRVALKVLLTSFLDLMSHERFEREAELMGSIEHPNIARLYGTGFWQDVHFEHPYLVMERVEGQSLTAYCDNLRLGVRERMQLLVTVARATHYVHTRGVVHRDLKPQNILVDQDGAPKILDFGVARALETSVNAALTVQGEQVGTLPYMAPEQLAGDQQAIDLRIDVYALGVIAYQLLAGRLPYHPEAFRTVISAMQTLQRDPPERQLRDLAIPRDLKVILAKAMHGERDLRYGSAIELAMDLERFLSNQAILAQPPGLLHGLRLFMRRRAALSSAIGLSVASLLTAVTLSVHFGVREAAAHARADARASEALATNDFLEDILIGADPGGAKGLNITMREVLASARDKLTEQAASNPAVAVRAGLLIGNTQYNLGDEQEGVATVEAAVERAGKIPNIDPELREAAIVTLGGALANTAQVSKAQKLLTPLLADPPGDKETGRRNYIAVRLALAIAAVRTGQAASAAEYLRELGDLPRQWFGANDGDVQYVEQRRFNVEFALGHFQGLLAEHRQRDAKLLREQGRLSIVRQELMAEAGISALELGELAVAERLLTQHLELATETFGADTQWTLLSAQYLAYVSHLLRPEQREPLLRLAALRDRIAAKAGPDDQYLTDADINYGSALLQSDRAADRKRGEELLGAIEQNVRSGALHSNGRSLRGRLILAQYLDRTGRHAEAHDFYATLCPDMRQHLVTDHPYQARCRAGEVGQIATVAQR